MRRSVSRVVVFAVDRAPSLATSTMPIESSAASLSHCFFQHLDVLQPFDGSHILGAFEGSRIGAAELAHAALHLLHRLIFVLFHPFADAQFHMTQMPDSIAQQS